MARVLVIDNYDSFVYNLVQYVGELGSEPVVVRNDECDIDALFSLEPDALIVSPGPGRPEEAGVSTQAVLSFGNAGIPVLGVCLGHQCIGEAFGGAIVAAPELMHGKTSEVHHDNKGVFSNLADPFVATRYHSLVVEPASLPEVLEVSATTADGVIMGLRHRTLLIEGVQFHPESILTSVGHELLANFLSLASSRR